MISKSEIKLIQSLRLKKFRQKYNLFVAEGEKTVRTLFSHGRFQLHQLYAISSWTDVRTIGVSPSEVRNCTKEELKKLSSLQSSPSVIAVLKIPEDNPNDLKALPKEIYLDDIQDPGNLGAIIRIADWYGVDRIVRSEGSADFYNPKVIQATMGSIANVRLKTLLKKDFEAYFSSHYKIGASMVQKGKFDNTRENLCLIIGNEGKGISSEISRHLNCHLHIPGSEDRVADSLNASVAAGILAQRIFGNEIN